MSEIKTNIEEEIEELLKACRELNFQKRKDALDVSNQVIELARANQLSHAMVKGMVWQATILSDTFSEYDRAIAVCKQALQIAEQEQSPDLLVRVHCTFGVCYHYLGDLQSSHHHYLQAITIAEEKVNSTPLEREGLGNLYYNVAVLFKTKEFSHLRQNYLKRAVEIYEQNDFKLGLSRCYNAYSAFYSQNGELDTAVQFQKKALAISEEINDRHGISIYTNNIGSMYIEMKQFEKGLQHLNKALALKTEIGNKHSIAVSHLHIGMAHHEMENFDLALQQFHESESLLKEIKSHIFLHEIYEQLVKTYVAKKDFEKAYQYQVKLIEASKELQNFDKTAAIFEAEAKLESEKREKEAQLLRQKNEEIKDYIKLLEASNNELKQFAHVASHDLKEPLRMISSYISLVDKKAGDKLSADEKLFLQFAVDGAKRMDALISDLLDLSKLSSSVKKEQVDLNKTAEETLFNLLSTIKESNASVSFDHLPIVQADKTQMFQLFQNLISNAIKYNKTNQPTIHIAYERVGHTDVLKFKDNGIGIPPEHRERVFVLFQRLHSRNEYTGTGIGLAICRKIVEQMNGTIHVEDNEGGGSIFVIQISAA